MFNLKILKSNKKILKALETSDLAERAKHLKAALGIVDEGRTKATTAKVASPKVTEKISSGDLSKLGAVYEVKIGNKKYDAVMLKVSSLKEWGIDLETVFKDCPYNKEYSTRDGFIVDVDLYQQAALLKALNKKNPKLKIGMFNHLAAEDVYKALNKANVHNKSDIWWFWTGEKFPGNWNEKSFAKPGLVFANNLEDIEGSRFVVRRIDYGYADTYDPVLHYLNGAVVFGAQK